MKISTFLIVVLFAATIPSAAQDVGKWFVGVNFSTFGVDLKTELSINRYIGNRLTIGVMPYAWVDIDNPFKDYLWGLNLNLRYYILKNTKFLPYVYALGGYSKEHYDIGEGQYYERYRRNGFNYSVGIGTQMNIGKSGWSLDMNLGYQYIKFENAIEKNWLSGIDYSIGIIKRFGKKKKP